MLTQIYFKNKSVQISIGMNIALWSVIGLLFLSGQTVPTWLLVFAVIV